MCQAVVVVVSCGWLPVGCGCVHTELWLPVGCGCVHTDMWLSGGCDCVHTELWLSGGCGCVHTEPWLLGVALDWAHATLCKTYFISFSARLMVSSGVSAAHHLLPHTYTLHTYTHVASRVAWHAC